MERSAPHVLFPPVLILTGYCFPSPRYIPRTPLGSSLRTLNLILRQDASVIVFYGRMLRIKSEACSTWNTCDERRARSDDPCAWTASGHWLRIGRLDFKYPFSISDINSVESSLPITRRVPPHASLAYRCASRRTREQTILAGGARRTVSSCEQLRKSPCRAVEAHGE